MSPYAFVVAWVVQGILLGLIALALPRVFRMRQPALLESWWRVGALAVVVLPLVPLVLPARAASSSPVIMRFVDSTSVVLSDASVAPSELSPISWLVIVWAIGALVRLAWIVAGQRRLRRLAIEGVMVNDDAALADARELAGLHLDTEVPQSLTATRRVDVPVLQAPAAPCVFGWPHATVLVPLMLADLPHDQRLAVYLHELLHAARSDVRRSYVDEAWRTVWWWQPAVWWMLARVRLTRELHVDRAVVASTGARRAYVEALLWCGARRWSLAMGAPVGAGRHALVRRVAVLCEEVEMSRLRRWCTAAGMVVTFGIATAWMGMYSPLRAAQEAGVPYADVAASSGPGPLERAAVVPTLDAPAPRRVFAVDPVWNEDGVGYRFRVNLVLDAGGNVAEARVVVMAGMALSTDARVPHAAAARQAAIAAVRQWQFEPPITAPMLVATDVTVGRIDKSSDMYTRRVQSEETGNRSGLRVGGNINLPRQVHRVSPVYPPAAQEAAVQGVVILECTVGPDGSVTDVTVLRSIPLLDQAAIDAVRQWRYEPTLLNGEPITLVMTTTINFTLQ